MNKLLQWFFLVSVSILIGLGCYVLVTDGGSIKLWDSFEVKSNRGVTKSGETTQQPKQAATVSGSGQAINADNGAVVNIKGK